MLKMKNGWTQNFVLLTFAGLLLEVLTPGTLIFLSLGLGLSFLEMRPSKWVRNLMAVTVLASYWITYGKFIDPEIGLNFLTSIIVIKILEKESARDHYMIFFGLMLLISAGSLFERTITYVLFFGISFLVLVRDFYQFLGQRWRMKELGIATLWVIPLTFTLFFAVPRLLNPIPFQSGQTRPGEIGYTPDVNLSEIESLGANTSPVFQVLVSRTLSQKELYWRGNVLSMTDGWNWRTTSLEQINFESGSPDVFDKNEVNQVFRFFEKLDYFFTLDHPKSILFGKETYVVDAERTLKQKRWQWVQRYEAQSIPKSAHTDSVPLKRYLTLPLKRDVKLWIQSTFKGTNLKEIESEVSTYFEKQAFTYSLSPGKSVSFEDFMLKKKIGLCSHYASALALILRAKGIPARMISGFMGGSYNHYADFYLISQNDAHTWVEAYENGQWLRLDPTEWIAPDRVLLGGEAFMESVRNGRFEKDPLFKVPGFVREMKQWLGQWDFIFYLWLEQMDFHFQEAWLSRLKMKRHTLFSLIPILLAVFMGGYYLWILARGKRKKNLSEYQLIWGLFYTKMERLGVKLSDVRVNDSEEILRKLIHPKKELILSVWVELVRASFRTEDLTGIKKKIKKI